MQYQALVTRDGRASNIEFPDCPGCATFAEPDEDVLATAREALEGWLEAELVAGRVPPAPTVQTPVGRGRSVIAVYIAPALAARVQIRQARVAQSLSQGELAKLVGVSRQAVSQLESPDANLRLSTLEKVAAVLELDVDLTLRPRQKVAAASRRAVARG